MTGSYILVFQFSSVTQSCPTLCNPMDCSMPGLPFHRQLPVHPKGAQSWVVSGGTDVEAETPILWPSDGKSWLIWKDPDAGRHWGQEEKGTAEDEMVGWHHWLNGHEFGWTLGVGDGQGGLACCGSWVAKSQTRLSDWTEHAYTTQSHLQIQCSPHQNSSGIFHRNRKQNAKTCM